MSHYLDITTEIKDKKALVEALCRVGFKKENIEVHDIPQHLYGYRGDQRSQRANVIIRRKYVGSASNDLGFEKLQDGRYLAHISEYDKKHRYGEEWQSKLYTYYGVEKAKMECTKLGRSYVEDVDHKQRPRLRVQI